MSTEVCGVYVAKNLVTGHVYVGSSLKCKTRVRDHKRNLNRNKHTNKYFQNAWNRYGEDNFEWRIHTVCKPDKRLEKEQKLIEALHANEKGCGYNVAYPVRSVVPSKRMSRIQKGYWDSLIGKEREKRITHLRDEDGVRKSISETMTKLWKDSKFREKRLAGLTRGRNKTNANPSAAALSILASGRAKAVAKNKTPEARIKQRANNLAQWQDPAIRAVRLAALARGRVTQQLRAFSNRTIVDNDIV